jgi:hypothetical protein
MGGNKKNEPRDENRSGAMTFEELFGHTWR